MSIASHRTMTALRNVSMSVSPRIESHRQLDCLIDPALLRGVEQI